MTYPSEIENPPRLLTPTDAILPLLLGVAILIGVAILTLGSGLQGTLIAVRAGSEGMPQVSIGLMMAAFFFGYAFGSILTIRLIIKVGHIRTFAALASVTSAVALLHVLSISPTVWILLRGIHGFCYAGLILAIESWLNASADSPKKSGLKLLTKAPLSF